AVKQLTATPASLVGASGSPSVTSGWPIERRPIVPGTSVGRASTQPQAAAVVGGSWSLLGPKPISTAYLRGEQHIGLTSGRITALTVSPANTSVVYAGSAGGGVWKSTNGGGEWTPLTDNRE